MAKKAKRGLTQEEKFAAAFTEWDTLWREHPEKFESTAEHLLQGTAAEYGPQAARVFVALLKGTFTLDD